MNEKELWITLGEKLNEQGLYFEDLVGHISVLNADDSSFVDEEEKQIAVNSALDFLSTLEKTLNDIMRV